MRFPTWKFALYPVQASGITMMGVMTGRLRSFYTCRVGNVLHIASFPAQGLRTPAHESPQPRRPPLRFPLPPAERESPLALWHLLSLDAPTVATLWTAFLAHSNGIQLPAASLMAMFVAVWLLYAGDRLLDTRSSIVSPEDLEARHRFHARHRNAFVAGIGAAVLILAILLPTLPPAALRLYLIEGSFLAGYFLLIHGVHLSRRLPKELAVGLFFAAATFIPTISRQPSLRRPMVVPALLLIALCSLNCLFIYRWEHPHTDTPPLPTRFALRHLRVISLALFLGALTTAALEPTAARTIAGAIAASTTLLVALDACRKRLGTTTLRAAADLALLTPALFLVFP